MEDVKQIIEPESQETNINIDYYQRCITVYSCKATVINRMLKNGYEPYSVEKINGEICSAIFEFDFDNFPKFIHKGLFKCV